MTKSDIILCCILFGSPLIYYLLIILITFNPDILIDLKLGSFIEYIMYDFQPEGYDNVVRLTNHKFAVYFFHVHSAGIIIFISFSSITIIFSAIKYSNHKNNKRIIENPQRPKWIHIKHIPILSILIILCSTYMQANFPIVINNDTKININNENIISFVFYSGVNLSLILMGFASLYISIFSYHLPRLKICLLKRIKKIRRSNFS